MLDIDRAKVEVPYRIKFGKQDSTCIPRFVDRVLGNGNALLCFLPLGTRPHYYVIRGDSSWHLPGCVPAGKRTIAASQ
jgi:hypothetical protein